MNRDQLVKALDKVVCKELNLDKDQFFLIGGSAMVIEDKLLGVKHLTMCLKESECGKVKCRPHTELMFGSNPEIFAVQLSLSPIGIERDVGVKFVVDDYIWRHCNPSVSSEGYRTCTIDSAFLMSRFPAGDGDILLMADITPDGVMAEGSYSNR